MTSTDEEHQIDEYIDVDLLNTSIEERSVLWDNIPDLLLDRNRKRKCWRRREVFCRMTPGF